MRERARLGLVERPRAEDERLFQRLEERRHAASGEHGGGQGRRANEYGARAHRK
jgi:hypothetical protein